MSVLILLIVVFVLILLIGAYVWYPDRCTRLSSSTGPGAIHGHFSMRCVNLVRSADRRLFIEHQVLGCGFIDDWVFEEGIDGRQLVSVEQGTYVLSDGSTLPYTVTLSDGSRQPVDPGLLGCTLSHIKAITGFQTDYCLIIEDDTFLSMCHLHKDFDVDHIIQNAPADWGILQLGCNQHSVGAYRPWVSADRMYGTYAYLVKRSCADQIRSLLVQTDGTIHIDQTLTGEKHIHADFFLYGLVNTSTNFRVYTHTVFSTYNNKSTLDSTLHVESTDRHIVGTMRTIAELVHHRFAISLTTPKQTQTMVEASLCIPCHFEHLETLRILLLSLHLQECMTQEVVLSFSSVPRDIDAMRLTAMLQPLVPDTNLRIFASHDVQYAGTNRNICIQESRHDILIFIDADDLMYTSRIRTVYELLASRPRLASLLHSYTRPTTPSARSLPYAEMLGTDIFDLNLEWVDSISLIQIPADTEGKDGYGMKSNGFLIHNGHPVLRRSRLVQNDIWYTDAKRGQDAMFNRTLLHTLGRSDDTMAFINVPLTYYVQENSSTTFLPRGPIPDAYE